MTQQTVEVTTKQITAGWTGLVIYPRLKVVQLAGGGPRTRATREQVVTDITEEIRKEEPEAAEEGLRLLDLHDEVRIGQAVVMIIGFDTDIERTGCEPLSATPTVAHARTPVGA